MAVHTLVDEGGLPSRWILGSLALLVVSVALLLWRKVSRDQNPSQRWGATKQPSAAGASLNDEEESLVVAQPLTILYGTQTGTAEGFAKILAGEVKARYRSAVSIQTMDVDEFGATETEYAEKFGKERVVCLLLATYGDGEPTDSAARFCKWLASMQEEAAAGLPHLQYAVFGLGNKQYEHFNKVGKAVDAQLTTLGARAIVPLGLGDDDACLEDDFTLWREALLSALDSLMKSEAEGTYEVAVPRYRLRLVDAEETEGRVADPAPGLFWAPLVVRRELHTRQSERSAVHCEVDIGGAGMSYCAGDHVALYPQNESSVVEAAARCLGLPLETRFELEVEEKGSSQVAPFPGPCSLRTALACYADLLSSPKKAALLALAAHAASEQDAERLRHLGSPAGKAEYAVWVVEAQRTLVEVLAAFPSCCPPLEVFFAAVAPRLQPRFYSISSSPRVAGSSIHITCAVVEERREGGRVHRGVASTWLKERCVGTTRVPLFVRPSTFRLPSDPLVPIIMVGPGTGLAPFRGFLQERSAVLQEGGEVGEAHLFFGCRTPHADYIYKEELEAFAATKALTHLHTAFSRVSEGKAYVQHALAEQATALWALLNEGGAHIYVCGDAKAMAKDVHRTLHSIVQQEGAMSTSAAEATVKRWQMDGRYLRDVW